MTRDQKPEIRVQRFRWLAAALALLISDLCCLTSGRAQSQAVPVPAATLIATAAPSGSPAVIQFTGLAGNQAYALSCHGIQVGINNSHLQLQVQEGGATWETGSSYWEAALANNSSGSAAASFDSEAAAGIFLDWSTGIVSNAASALAVIDVQFADLASATGYKIFKFTAGFQNGSSHSNSTFGYGHWHGDTNPITGVQLNAGGNAITGGACNLYQLAGS